MGQSWVPDPVPPLERLGAYMPGFIRSQSRILGIRRILNGSRLRQRFRVEAVRQGLPMALMARRLVEEWLAGK